MHGVMEMLRCTLTGLPCVYYYSYILSMLPISSTLTLRSVCVVLYVAATLLLHASMMGWSMLRGTLHGITAYSVLLSMLLRVTTSTTWYSAAQQDSCVVLLCPLTCYACYDVVATVHSTVSCML